LPWDPWRAYAPSASNGDEHNRTEVLSWRRRRRRRRRKGRKRRRAH
jgi:hypothetical protein